MLTKNSGSPEFDEEINEIYNKFNENEIDKSSVKLVTPSEVTRAIKRRKPRKAPGLDGIQIILLKNIPKKLIVQLMYLFYACLINSYWPSNWKTANILAFKKPSKDKTMPINYRPISLLPTLSKLFEQIILNRLNEHENKHQQLIDEQFGFRSN